MKTGRGHRAEGRWLCPRATNTAGMSWSSTGTEHWRDRNARSARLAKTPSPQNVPALLAARELAFANGPCGALCAEGPHPPEFPSPVTASWLIRAVGREERDVQDANRTPELRRMEKG